MSAAIRASLTSRDVFRGLFRLLGHRFVTFACLVPAWLAAHDAQMQGHDPTGVFVTTLAALVGINLLCRLIARRLERRMGFTGKAVAAPKAAPPVPPQPVSVAVSRHGGPNLRQVARMLPSEMKALLR